MSSDLADGVPVSRLRASPAMSSESAGAVALAFGAAAVLCALAATHGGYYPTAWGWSALILFWAAAVGLVLQRWTPLRPLEWATLAALAAFVGWVALSTLWTRSPAQTPLEIERGLVYVAGLFALLVFVRPRSVAHLLVGVLTATTIVSVYALATRLFPDRIGSFDSIAAYRLDAPMGYWNALGIFVVIGAIVGLGIAARGGSLLGRALAGAAAVPLMLTLYFTFSRGAWIGLALGLLTAIAVDRRRLQLIVTALVVAPWAAVAVLAASRSGALTRTGAPLAQASREGHRLAAIALILAAVAGAAVAVLVLVERRVRVRAALRLSFAVMLTLAAVAGALAAVARYGSPPTMVRKAYAGFNSPPVSTSVPGADLNQRVFNLSGNGRATIWKAAWRDYEAHPLLGSGAGSYERYWLAHRPRAMKVRDAHSLYLEVLAELGPIGLGLLLVALGIPLAAAVRARRHPLVPAVLGAYVAYLFHAGIDWDWEMVAVTLSALACGAALLKADAATAWWELRWRGRAALATAALALSVFALVGLIGNAAVAAANRASLAHDWEQEAKDATRAMRFAPWRTDAWRLRAESRYSVGRAAGARADLQAALRKDPHDWNVWWDLAVVDAGRARRAAFEHALALDPLSPELAQSRSWLGIPAPAG